MTTSYEQMRQKQRRSRCRSIIFATLDTFLRNALKNFSDIRKKNIFKIPMQLDWNAKSTLAENNISIEK